MNRFNILRSTLYNKVWEAPKKQFVLYLRRRCDRIPENRRLAVVTVIMTLFVMTAFFLFGNACYRIGRGQAAAGRIEVSHIEGLELPAYDKSDSLMMKPLSISYDVSGTEKENQRHD